METVTLKIKLKKPLVFNCRCHHRSQSSYLKQELTQGYKCRPVIRLLSPALQHDVIDILRAVFRLRQAFPFFINLVQDLGQNREGGMT